MPVVPKPIRLLFQNTLVRIVAAISGLIVAASAFSAIVGGLESARDTLTWAVWIYQNANTPWIGIFVLLLIGSLFWIGTTEVKKEIAIQSHQITEREKILDAVEVNQIKAIKSLARSNAEALEAEISPIKEFLEEHILLCDIRESLRQVNDNYRSLQPYRHCIHTFENHKFANWKTDEDGIGPLSNFENFENRVYVSPFSSKRLRQLLKPKLNYLHVGASESVITWDIESNQEYIDAHRINLERIETYINQASNDLSQKIQAIENTSAERIRKLHVKLSRRF